MKIYVKLDIKDHYVYHVIQMGNKNMVLSHRMYVENVIKIQNNYGYNMSL